MRGAKVKVKCANCDEEFLAKVADRKRGWGRFCSKSCKASKQEKKTGQNARYLKRKNEDRTLVIPSFESGAFGHGQE